MHIHPLFAIIGFLSCVVLLGWPLVALAFLVARRKRVSLADCVMCGSALFVAVAIMIPDTFFA
jgi:hypothetical protein